MILLHGLAGCHASSYVVRVCQKLVNAGFRVWRLDARGSGAGVGLARYHHHAGRIEDLQAAIDFISSGNDDAPLTMVGFSLGGNLVLNWLTSRHAAENRKVDSTISVAPPVNLFQCTRNLRSGLGRGYDLYFARMMLRRVAERRRAVPHMIDFRFSRTPETLAQFDSQFTAPAGGFADLNDYYEQCSSLEKLHRIDIPTLLIIDETDPVIPVSMFEPQRLSNAIQVLKTWGGGHLGYIGKRAVDPDRHWLDWRIVQAISFIDNPETRS